MDTLQALRHAWSARAPRERRLLALGALFLALMAAYLLLIDPAASGIARLQRLLPQARAQAAELDALAAEAKRLRSLPPAAAPGAADARAAISRSLQDAGLAAARIQPLAGGDLRLSFTDVPYGRWTSWLAQSEHTLGVHALAVTVKATATPGNTDIDLTLRLPRA